MSFFGSKEFFFEVAKGNVAGHTSVGLVGLNPAVGSKFEDVWDEGGIQIMPIAAETWEILSDDAADNVAGSGARTVLVKSLDINYVEQIQAVNLSGVTPVALTGTHFRPNIAVLSSAGSGEVNQGNISIRDATSNNVRLKIQPENGTSFSSHFTVPAGKTMFAQSIVGFIPKNEDVTARLYAKAPASGSAFISAGEIQVYQDSAVIPISSPIALLEKTDIKFQAKSTNAAVGVSVFASFVMVDNDI